MAHFSNISLRLFRAAAGSGHDVAGDLLRRNELAGGGLHARSPFDLFLPDADVPCQGSRPVPGAPMRGACPSRLLRLGGPFAGAGRLSGSARLPAIAAIDRSLVRHSPPALLVPLPDPQAGPSEADSAAIEAAEKAVVESTDRYRVRREQVADFWRPRNPTGHNVGGPVAMSSAVALKTVRILGATLPAAHEALSTMIVDYPAKTRFSVTVEDDAKGVMAVFDGSDKTKIKRLFLRNAYNGLEVHHIRFEAGSTGEGAGKQLFRTSVGVYQSLGAACIRVESGLTVGGYAWARYGYRPDDWDALRQTLTTKLESLHLAAPMTPGQRDAARLPLADPDATTLWKLADLSVDGRKLGKELLLGSTWFGTLPLEDASCMQCLERYLGAPQFPAASAAPVGTPVMAEQPVQAAAPRCA